MVGGRASPIDERRFHDWLRRALPAARRGPLPLGDDAAAVLRSRRRYSILTTDALVEGTHFLPRSDPDQVGAAAAAVSLSDAASKGAHPSGLLLALLLPPGSPMQWAQHVALGADRMGRRFGAPLLGGDTKASPIRAVISTVHAEGERRRMPPRSGARPGDLLVTTGAVGKGGAVAELLRRRPRSQDAARAVVDVVPRVREGLALARLAHAMIDTSDGLSESARLIAAASRVKLTVDETSLPVVPTLRKLRHESRFWDLLFFGGDYELLATFPPVHLGAARDAFHRLQTPLTVIGEVSRGHGAWLRIDGKLRPLPPATWAPLRAES